LEDHSCKGCRFISARVEGGASRSSGAGDEDGHAALAIVLALDVEVVL